MKSREEIYSHVVGLMSDMFELDPQIMCEDSRLYDDLDIDSIDAVDLIVELKSYTGKKVAPEDFKNVRTVRDIVSAVEDLLENE
ncbi:acyl carrier protein [Haliea sp. E1-2-M8]|uniref:acyl carrier protein n=1 Tax=Haliea sp. E1-2-M8 TaxID=3064706 RepID=UPI00272445F5|nr:acyl carrier protein [Haliea sp. E1-2-M8]MDO8861118.1 acyl carrier protein [Haliea sp. E1-2-M8]